MFSEIITAGTYGIDGFKVSVESDISKGMPGITIVGLPAVAVKESKDRIKSAITNSFFQLSHNQEDSDKSLSCRYQKRRLTLRPAYSSCHYE